ncbi:MAG: MarR family winged helix-turn-helix transcriptional regulator [Myxococcota bacterium]|nr:MarR family winged helix-turn-helix transcriptional regulator [Myxococcota bacterium]
MTPLPVGYLLKRTHLLYRGLMDGRLAPLECSAAMYEVLFHLHHGGPQSGSQVAAAAGVTPQTMHRQTKGMLEAGLLEARAGRGRAITLALTPAGETLFGRACDELEALEAQLAQGLSADERAELGRLLQRAEQNLQPLPSD